MDGIDASCSLYFLPEQMVDLAPFYFCVDRKFAIVQMGRELQRLYPDLSQGASVWALFDIQPPESFVFDGACLHTPYTCTVHCKGRELFLQGTVVQEHQQDVLVFMGTPVDFPQEGSGKIAHQDITQYSASAGSSHRQLEVLYSLSRIFCGASGTEDPIFRVMETVGVLLGWSVGVYWLLPDGEKVFSCSATWHDDAQKMGVLTEALANSSITTSIKEVETTIGTKAISYIGLEDMERVFTHGQLAVQCGIQSICLVPIYSADKVVGLYEFFRSVQPPSGEKWMETMMEAGRQTGAWIARVRMERELRMELEHERENNALKTRFISVMSHDFRTPLTAILSSADLMEYLSDKLSAEQRGEYLGFIREAVERMTTLLDHVRFIRKVEERQIILYPTSVDLPSFCDKVLQAMQEQDAGRHTVQCVVQGNGEKTRVDDKLLWEICTHLISNALKYSPVGTNVVFRVTHTDKELEIEVENTGIGIPKGEQKEIFTPFSRATNVGVISGAGLGLSIVQHAVELHKGVIHVLSEQGEGAIFTVRLPLEY